VKKKHIHETLCQISLVFHGPREYYFGKVMKKLNHIIYKIAFMVVDYCGKGEWKTRNAGTTRISRNGFIFAIKVMCKHYHATDGEDFATD